MNSRERLAENYCFYLCCNE